jgi:tetratricopeptide (TPR) repeat protein
MVFVVTALVVNRPITAPTDGFDFRAELAMCVGHARAALGNYDEAEEYLRRALHLNPRYTDAACQLADVLALRGKFDEAEQLLQQAVKWDGQSSEPWRMLAGLLHRRASLAEATAAFQEALAIDPTSPEAHAGIADVFIDDGKTDQAIDHYREALRLSDEPGPLLIRLADALVQKQAYVEAIDCYRRGLWQVEPKPSTLNRIAWLLATCPQVELRDCERAIEISEHLCRLTDYAHAVALDTLAAAYAECGRWAEAVTFARRAIEIAVAKNDPKTADSIRQRLEIYEDRLSTIQSGGLKEPTTTRPPAEP